MSDCWINWRFGTRHLKLHKGFPWEITFTVNPYHVVNPPKTWFENMS